METNTKFLAIRMDSKKEGIALIKKLAALADVQNIQLADAVLAYRSTNRKALKFLSLPDILKDRVSSSTAQAAGVTALYSLLMPIFLPITIPVAAASAAVSARQELSEISHDLKTQHSGLVKEHVTSKACVVLIWIQVFDPTAVAQALLGTHGVIITSEHILPNRVQLFQRIFDG